MRASVAILFLAVAACVNASEAGKNTISDVIACAKVHGVPKCIAFFGIWRAERALHPKQNNTFCWRHLANVSDDELYAKLCDSTEKLLQHRSLIMDISSDYAIQLKASGSSKLNFDIIPNASVSTGRTSMKKMTKMFYEALPFLILPGLVMSAVLPFFLPTLKMATLATGMLNNLALSGAIFTLLRNNAFNDKKYPKKVIYVNAGYGDKYNLLAEGTNDDTVATNFDTSANNFDTQYSTEVTHDVKDYHLIGMDPNTGISYPFNSDWLKNNGNEGNKVKNVQIIGEVPTADWTKPNFPVKWRKHNRRFR